MFGMNESFLSMSWDYIRSDHQIRVAWCHAINTFIYTIIYCIYQNLNLHNNLPSIKMQNGYFLSHFHHKIAQKHILVTKIPQVSPSQDMGVRLMLAAILYHLQSILHWASKMNYIVWFWCSYPMSGWWGDWIKLNLQIYVHDGS